MPPFDDARLSGGAALLLTEFEAEGARLAALRAEAEVVALRRARIEAALRALAPTLPPEDARRLRRRIYDSRSEGAAPEPARGAPQTDLLRLLAAWPRAAITVAEAQARLTERGHAVRRTYAAGVLTVLARRGVVVKTGRGKYRVVKGCAELAEARLEG